MRAHGQATKALLITATLAGGLGGTGQAAENAAYAGMDKELAMTAQPANPRKDHLKQLWSKKGCVKK